MEMGPPVDDLRSRISYIPQEAFLFTGEQSSELSDSQPCLWYISIHYQALSGKTWILSNGIRTKSCSKSWRKFNSVELSGRLHRKAGLLAVCPARPICKRVKVLSSRRLLREAE